MEMSKIMENLINNKYYATAKEVTDKLSVFFAYNMVTQDDYTKLMDLTKKVYDAVDAPKQ